MNIEKLRSVQRAINEAWMALETATSPVPATYADRAKEEKYALWIQARFEGISTRFHPAYRTPQIDQNLTTPEAVEKTYDNLYRDVRSATCSLDHWHRDWLYRIFL